MIGFCVPILRLARDLEIGIGRKGKLDRPVMRQVDRRPSAVIKGGLSDWTDLSALFRKCILKQAKIEVFVGITGVPQGKPPPEIEHLTTRVRAWGDLTRQSLA